jgi:hypothetical protein
MAGSRLVMGAVSDHSGSAVVQQIYICRGFAQGRG